MILLQLFDFFTCFMFVSCGTNATLYYGDFLDEILLEALLIDRFVCGPILVIAGLNIGLADALLLRARALGFTSLCLMSLRE